MPKQPRKSFFKMLRQAFRRAHQKAMYWYAYEKDTIRIALLGAILAMIVLCVIIFTISCTPQHSYIEAQQKPLCANVYDENGKPTSKVLCKNSDGNLEPATN